MYEMLTKLFDRFDAVKYCKILFKKCGLWYPILYPGFDLSRGIIVVHNYNSATTAFDPRHVKKFSSIYRNEFVIIYF